MSENSFFSLKGRTGKQKFALQYLRNPGVVKKAFLSTRKKGTPILLLYTAIIVLSGTMSLNIGFREEEEEEEEVGEVEVGEVEVEVISNNNVSLHPEKTRNVLL